MIIDEQFKSLHEKLSNDFTWPSVYMFKFIIPTVNTEELAILISHFDPKSEIDYKQSSSGKYVSVTIKELLESPNAVIDKYQKAATIKGVMSL